MEKLKLIDKATSSFDPRAWNPLTYDTCEKLCLEHTESVSYVLKNTVSRLFWCTSDVRSISRILRFYDNVNESAQNLFVRRVTSQDLAFAFDETPEFLKTRGE